MASTLHRLLQAPPTTLREEPGMQLATIDFARLENVSGGYDWKRTGKKMFGGAVSGATAGAVGGLMTGGPPAAGGAALVGGVTGALGAGVYDAGQQLHMW
jgi:hypothetical protein